MRWFLLFLLFVNLDAFQIDSIPFDHEMILDPEVYNDDDLPTLWDQLRTHIEKQPLNLFFTFIFFLGIIHTFWAHRMHMASKKRSKADLEVSLQKESYALDKRLSRQQGFWGEMLAFLGEVEVVFGIWCIPILIAITLFYDWSTAVDYINREDYTIPLFIMVSVVIASSYPFVRFAEEAMRSVAKLGGERVIFWWFIIMTLGPFLGSIVKETVAMAITAVLLGRHFFRFSPSPKLAYTTVAMLFLNVSVGGMSSNFASSAISVVAKHWDWSSLFMVVKFGWKAFLGIIVSNGLVVLYFRREFAELQKRSENAEHEEQLRVPVWIMLVHIFMLIWIVFNYNSPVIAMGSFVLFLGFYQATAPYQNYLNLREPILVAFFVASVSVHAGLQIWWLDPLISRLSDFWAMKVTLCLSAFINNTSVNYLMTHIPELTDSLKYALVSGTMIGSGFTIMANGPNLVGYSLLEKYFNYEFSPGKLFLAAIIPTGVMYLAFSL